MTASTEKVFSVLANGHLKAEITSGSGTITLEPGEIFPFIVNWLASKNMYLTITDVTGEKEIVKVTGISGDILSVTRGQDGTAARLWYAGSIVSQRGVATDFTSFLQKGDERMIAYDPNGILTAAYPGEKVIETGLSECQNRAWKNFSGTTWHLIAGEECAEVIEDIYGSANDGWVRNQGAPGTWAGYRDAVSGTLADNNDSRHTDAIQASYHDGWYWIYRSFFAFDLSGIPAASTVSAVALMLRGYANDLGNVSIQQGTQQTTIDVTDYDAFTGNLFDTLAWTTGDNEYELNADGITYIQSVVAGSGIAKICARNYDNDVLNVDPAPGPTWNNCGCYFADTGTASNKPKLTVTYS